MLLAEATRLPHLIFRLPRFLYRPNESGTKASILPFDTATIATISVDTIYDLRLAQANRKKYGGRSAPIFARVYTYIYICKCVFFTLRHLFLLRPRVFPRALGSVAHRGPARTPYASLGPGRGPWHVLWGLKVARPLGEAFRARRTIQAHANPNVHNTLSTG